MFNSAPKSEGMKKLTSALEYNRAYIAAVKKIWKSSDAQNLILEHTNAFYIRKDDRLRIGVDKDKDRILCDIYSDDALIRSELDTHRELFKLTLNKNGYMIDEVRIFPSKRGMLKRHPFRAKQ